MNNHITYNHKKSTEWHYFLSFFLVFLLNPLCGITACISYIVFIQGRDIPKFSYTTLFILIALFLGCINMTKIPTGDQIGYIYLFNKVPERGFYSIVFESWGGTGKEPFYSFITYIGYYLCFGKAPLFFFALTVTTYYLLFSATYNFLTKINATKAEIICAILSIAFFTQYFVLTIHLVRQILAMSIVMYAVVDRIVKGKNNWFLLIIAVLTHTSALLIALLSIIPALQKKMSLKQLIVIIPCFIILLIFNTQIGEFLGGGDNEGNFMEYAISRYSDNRGDGLAISYSLMLMVLLPLIIVSIKTLYTIRNNEHHPAYPMIYTCLLLILFVLSFSQNPLIQYRYFYYSYAFIPFILPLFFYQKKFKRINYDKIYCYCVSLFFIIRFFMIHNTSGFKFIPVRDIILLPFPYYFITDFY